MSCDCKDKKHLHCCPQGKLVERKTCILNPNFWVTEAFTQNVIFRSNKVVKSGYGFIRNTSNSPVNVEFLDLAGNPIAVGGLTATPLPPNNSLSFSVQNFAAIRIDNDAATPAQGELCVIVRSRL